MKKLTRKIALAMLLLWMLPFPAKAAKELIPVGQTIGLELQNGAVTVAGFEEALAGKLREAGLQVGDRILEVNGKTVTCAQDIRDALGSGGKVRLCVERKGKKHTLTMDAQAGSQGPRLGVYLRQGITGVGTVTWYDPETKAFGALGHGVNDSSGEPIALAQGSAYPAKIVTVRKGRCGEPGQLMGALAAKEPIGDLTANTSRGVFGTAENGWEGDGLPVASLEQIRTGEAKILSTVDDHGVQEYSVEILKLYPKSKENGRNMLLKVTDPVLLEATGGIVQGMSGSPIIQDGKLVGAVTHVLVNDPTTGYGIFIENMLDAAA